MKSPPSVLTGAVVIGRNEGLGLHVCLKSIQKEVCHLVYVDSGSTDNSCAIAQACGAAVVELNLLSPFTAARARNEGFKRLFQDCPHLHYVQFLDGDCEVRQGWISTAVQFLDRHPMCAVVCGRRREHHPKVSPYNALCDIEWDVPTGETDACGGDALVRISAFRDVEGYNPQLIAGEEPEMCLRLRQRGWHIHRLPTEMTWHDARMTRWQQWWKRSVRAGHAYWEVASFPHARSSRFWAREAVSLAFWGLLFPAFSLIAAGFFHLACLAFLLLYPIQWDKTRRDFSRYHTEGNASLYATFCLLGKVPMAYGACIFIWRTYRRQPKRLIEYQG